MESKYCRREVASIFFEDILDMAIDIEQDYHNNADYTGDGERLIKSVRALAGVVGEMRLDSGPITSELPVIEERLKCLVNAYEHDTPAAFHAGLHDFIGYLYPWLDLLVARDVVIVEAPSMTRVMINEFRGDRK